MNVKLSLVSVYILMRDRILLYSTYVIYYVFVISFFIFVFNIIIQKRGSYCDEYDRYVFFDLLFIMSFRDIGLKQKWNCNLENIYLVF